jgi:hypothetical protein
MTICLSWKLDVGVPRAELKRLPGNSDEAFHPAFPNEGSHP